MRKAVDAVNGEIFDAIGGMDAEDQVAIDETHDRRSTARPTRRGSAPTPSSAFRWPSPRRRPKPRGLPLYRYVGGA